MISADNILKRFKVRLGAEAPDEGLLEELVQSATEKAKAITWRRELPVEMEGLIVQLAIVFYNKLGIEGETSHGEGGISRSFDDLPPALAKELQAFRRAKVGR